MHKSASVLYNGRICGILSLVGKMYHFIYDNEYFNDPGTPPVSLTLPKTVRSFESTILFPFFYGLLSEGINKEVQCRTLKLDQDDYFGRLLRTADTDTIGAITIKEIE